MTSCLDNDFEAIVSELNSFGPGSFTAISSTAVSSTLVLSKPVSSTNKYLDFKVRLVSMHHFLASFMENLLWD